MTLKSVNQSINLGFFIVLVNLTLTETNITYALLIQNNCFTIMITSCDLNLFLLTEDFSISFILKRFLLTTILFLSLDYFFLSFSDAIGDNTNVTTVLRQLKYGKDCAQLKFRTSSLFLS